MKMGMRKPSIKKSISSRTTGKVTRAAKKATTPSYGDKGIGFAKSPTKSVKDKAYKKTSKSFWDLFK